MADNSTRLDASSSLETIASDDIGGAKYQRVKLTAGPDGTASDLLAANQTADGSTTGLLGVHPYLFNEATLDRQRGNTQGTLLASAARTAQVSTSVQTNYNARGVVIVAHVTAKAAATTLGFLFGVVDPISATLGYIGGNNVSAWPAAVNNTLTWIIYPGVLNSDVLTTGFQSQNAAASLLAPRSWAITVVPSDANSVTYSVAYFLVV